MSDQEVKARESLHSFFHRPGRWLDALVADWVTVYERNPRLYHRVAVSGVVLGLLTGGMVGAIVVMVVWLVTRG